MFFYSPISKGTSSVPSPSMILTLGDSLKTGQKFSDFVISEAKPNPSPKIYDFP